MTREEKLAELKQLTQEIEIANKKRDNYLKVFHELNKKFKHLNKGLLLLIITLALILLTCIGYVVWNYPCCKR